MYKHLQLTALIMLIALMLTPMSVLVAQVSSPFRCEACNGEPHIDPAACIKYQHASDCPCADCVAKRESPEANNETSLEDVVDSFGGMNFLYNPINTTWDYITERWDDFWGSIDSDTPNPYADYYGNGYYQ